MGLMKMSLSTIQAPQVTANYSQPRSRRGVGNELTDIWPVQHIRTHQASPPAAAGRAPDEGVIPETHPRLAPPIPLSYATGAVGSNVGIQQSASSTNLFSAYVSLPTKKGFHNHF